MTEQFYLIEERKGPTKNGPWSEWTWNPHPQLSFPRPFVTSRELTIGECSPKMIRTGFGGGCVWKELRCIPLVRAQPKVCGFPEILQPDATSTCPSPAPCAAHDPKWSIARIEAALKTFASTFYRDDFSDIFLSLDIVKHALGIKKEES